MTTRPAKWQPTAQTSPAVTSSCPPGSYLFTIWNFEDFHQSYQCYSATVAHPNLAMLTLSLLPYMVVVSQIGCVAKDLRSLKRNKDDPHMYVLPSLASVSTDSVIVQSFPFTKHTHSRVTPALLEFYLQLCTTASVIFTLSHFHAGKSSFLFVSCFLAEFNI